MVCVFRESFSIKKNNIRSSLFAIVCMSYRIMIVFDTPISVHSKGIKW